MSSGLLTKANRDQCRCRKHSTQRRLRRPCHPRHDWQQPEIRAHQGYCTKRHQLVFVAGAQFAVEKFAVGKLAHTPGTHCKESQPHHSVADAQDAAGLDHQFNHEVRHPGNMHKRNEKSPPEPIRHTDIRRQKLSNRTDSDGMNATKGEAMCTEYNFR